MRKISNQNAKYRAPMGFGFKSNAGENWVVRTTDIL
jgi:hypothetical protein